MARKSKNVLTDSGVDRRATGYYATPAFIAEYFFTRCLTINPDGQKVLDPCVGQEELFAPFLDPCVTQPFDLLGVDVIAHQHQYAATFQQQDFLLAYQPQAFKADYIVANPPYNCHEVDYIKQAKERLKKRFADVGVHNMYSMFLAAMIDAAQDGAVICCICDSSFLSAKVHKKLREKILSSCRIHDLLLCPTDLFLAQGANVRTCILVLQKGHQFPQSAIRLLNRPLSEEAFRDALATTQFDMTQLGDIILSGDADNSEFLIGVPRDIKKLFDGPRLAQSFACISGVSTGNDRLFIRKHSEPGFSIPFYKNPSSNKFYCSPNGFLTDDFLAQSQVDANFNVRNQGYLLQSGLTCSSMGVEFSACLLPSGSLFGVNPNIICDEQEQWWLLAYMNSDVVKYCVRGVLIRSNMITSGYVARLPLPQFTAEAKQHLTILAKQAYQNAQQQQSHQSQRVQINNIIFKELRLGLASITYISDFCGHIVKRT